VVLFGGEGAYRGAGGCRETVRSARLGGPLSVAKKRALVDLTRYGENRAVFWPSRFPRVEFLYGFNIGGGGNQAFLLEGGEREWLPFPFFILMMKQGGTSCWSSG